MSLATITQLDRGRDIRVCLPDVETQPRHKRSEIKCIFSEYDLSFLTTEGQLSSLEKIKGEARLLPQKNTE
jgi:hypothetical protein